MKKIILLICLFFFSTQLTVAAESLEEEAARRLPPVLYSLNMPDYCVSGEPVTVEWSILGYSNNFQSSIAFFNCADYPGNCGGKYSSNFLASENLQPNLREKGTWSYGDAPDKVYSTIFRYSYTFTPPEVSEPTDIIIRFYRINDIDAQEGLSGLSLLMPGDVSGRYNDTSGRRIVKTVLPRWNSISSISLTVPYLDQLDISGIGEAACASASTAMVLAYHHKVKNHRHALINAAETVFAETSSTDLGLLGRDRLQNHLLNKWDFSTVEINTELPSPLYEVIKTEIRSGRPLVLGTKSMTSAGHYMTVVGYDGNDYGSGSLIVHDPYGRWNNYDTGTGHIHADFTIAYCTHNRIGR